MKTIQELVLRCKYCKREMKDAIGYAENPFCNACLNERIEKTADSRDAEARREEFFRLRAEERKRSPDKL